MQSARVRIDRDVELPAGVLRIAPIETSANGSVFLAVWRPGITEGRNLMLQFVNGHVVVQGVNADKITINDLAVNPLTGNVFSSVSKAGSAAVVKIAADGKLSQVSLQKVLFQKVELPNAPEDKEVATKQGPRNARAESITGCGVGAAFAPAGVHFVSQINSPAMSETETATLVTASTHRLRCRRWRGSSTLRFS